MAHSKIKISMTDPEKRPCGCYGALVIVESKLDPQIFQSPCFPTMEICTVECKKMAMDIGRQIEDQLKAAVPELNIESQEMVLH